MFDISALKEMKLSELQEIAKLAKTIKFNGVKKETLISQILEHQVVNVDSASDTKKENNLDDDKPKRVRIVPVKKAAIQKAVPNSLFEKEEVAAEINAPVENNRPIEAVSK
jgi:transcription termination factor Rho